jgi:hypothetical protein
MTATSTASAAALAAYEEFTAAEEKVREAELEATHARNRLEAALETAGWRREHAAVLSPGTELYRHRRGGSTVEFAEVISTLHWEETIR